MDLTTATSNTLQTAPTAFRPADHKQPARDMRHSHLRWSLNRLQVITLTLVHGPQTLNTPTNIYTPAYTHIHPHISTAHLVLLLYDCKGTWSCQISRRADNNCVSSCHCNQVVLRPLYCIHRARPLAERQLITHGQHPVLLLLLHVAHAQQENSS